MKLLSAFLCAAAALSAAPALGQEPLDGTKVNQLIVYGDDPCPRGNGDEIIVCARKPEGERFRIPENLRDNPNDPINNAWANRAEALEYVGRTGTDSCSPVGPGGFTGCLNDLVRAARAERSSRDEINWNQLIEEARRERLGRIDEEAEAVEQEISPR